MDPLRFEDDDSMDSLSEIMDPIASLQDDSLMETLQDDSLMETLQDDCLTEMFQDNKCTVTLAPEA